MKNIQILFFILLFAVQSTIAQEATKDKGPNIRLKAEAADGKILLRWAPTNPKAWLDARKYGVTLERYLVISASGMNSIPEKQVLGTAIKPAPLSQWEQIAQSSDYAAVIAQAFYGEEFSLSSTGKQDIGTIINQATELQQRFSTSVFMAEYDFRAALLAGWGWEDTNVKTDEKYLYRIFLNNPDRSQADTTGVFIGLKDRKELPKPQPVQAVFGDKSVMLTWNYMLLSADYHSYWVERAVGNTGAFKRISELPVTPLDATSQDIYYTDSLTDNETTYTYRVCGTNTFGQEGPWSDVVSGKGIAAIYCIPAIISGSFPEVNKAHIFWELQCEHPEEISHLRIKHSTTVDGIFKVVADNIKKEVRELTFPLTDETNYLQVVACSPSGEEKPSFPYMVRQVDSIPPAIPTGLKVQIDSLGRAHLSWDANKEADLQGYRVLRSFIKTEEKTVLTPVFIKENTMIDTLSLQLMKREVYYSLTAADNRFNESQPCASVLALKPDVIPPSEPVFTSYKAEGETVKLSWLTDPEDTVTYYLFRKSRNDTISAELLLRCDYKTRSYEDSPPQSDCYVYTMMAIDGNHNFSLAPQPAEVCVDVDKPALKVSNFNAYVNHNDRYIELTWSKHPKALGYKIYRTEPGKEIKLLKELEADTGKLVDENIASSTDYQYTIVIVAAAGEKCKPEVMTVKY